MKVSIFQPTYLPWLGFFKAIAWADKFIFLDDAQFEKHSWQSRNKIKSATGEILLTVPIIRNFPQKINEVMINYGQDWARKHLKSIELNYCRTTYFKDFFPRLNKILSQRPEKLIALNVGLIKEICDYLKIKNDFYFSSELAVERLHKNEKIIAILKKLDADNYLYASGAAEYMKPELDRY